MSDGVQTRRGAMRQVVGRARSQFEEVSGRQVQSVSGVERADAGYRVSLEVIELPRIPESTSVMATFEVMLDDDGELIEFVRTRRYYRNRADADEG